MTDRITAIVKGQYQYPNMDKPKRFKSKVQFELYKPKDGENYYGTGCYMAVMLDNGNEQSLDCRYAGTTDIKRLAESFIKNYWGGNLREYTFKAE